MQAKAEICKEMNPFVQILRSPIRHLPRLPRLSVKGGIKVLRDEFNIIDLTSLAVVTFGVAGMLRAAETSEPPVAAPFAGEKITRHGFDRYDFIILKRGFHVAYISADAALKPGKEWAAWLRSGSVAMFRSRPEFPEVPQEPMRKFGRPLFQSMTYHDTPSQPVPQMRYVDASDQLGEKHTYAVLTANSVGLKSELSAAATPGEKQATRSSEFVSRPASQRGEMTLWYRQPAGKWLEALPLGNGLIGAMVFGGIQQERIALNESSFWSGRPHDYNDPEAGKYFSQIRDLVSDGQFQEAEKMADVHFYGIPVAQQAYQPLGDLVLAFDGVELAEDYRRELDMETGVAKLSYRSGDVTFTREAFVSYPDRVMVVRLTADKPGRFSVQPQLKSPYLDRVTVQPGKLVMDGCWKGPITNNWLIAPVEGKGLRFQAALLTLGHPQPQGWSDQGSLRPENRDHHHQARRGDASERRPRCRQLVVMNIITRKVFLVVEDLLKPGRIPAFGDTGCLGEFDSFSQFA